LDLQSQASIAKTTVYRAPTWSWTSINGAVEFVREERMGSRYLDLSIEVLDVFLGINPANPFGTLNKYLTSYIHMKGNLKRIPEMEIPSKNKPALTNRDSRRGIGRHWWIEIEIIDVEERMDFHVLATL
jgi:hypothetical protein